jgi:hypothetical protein
MGRWLEEALCLTGLGLLYFMIFSSWADGFRTGLGRVDDSLTKSLIPRLCININYIRSSNARCYAIQRKLTLFLSPMQSRQLQS